MVFVYVFESLKPTYLHTRLTKLFPSPTNPTYLPPYRMTRLKIRAIIELWGYNVVWSFLNKISKSSMIWYMLLIRKQLASFIGIQCGVWW
jgi:hypothetical protein